MNIVIVGHFDFPSGSAAASRVRHFAQGFVECGHRVWVITMAPARAQPAEAREDFWALWRGVHYAPAAGWTEPVTPRGRIGRIVQIFRDMRRDGRLAGGLIDRLHASAGVELVIGYSSYHVGLDGVMAHCAARGIPLVNDVVEWLSADSFAGGRCNPLYWDSVRGFRFLLPRSDGIIAISGFLERWFSDKGLPTLRIPSIIDPGEPPLPNPRAGGAVEPLVLTYLGNMIERDGPMLMIEAVRRALVEGCDVRFNVVGATERVAAAQRAKAVAQADPLLRKQVVFWGRVSDEEVQRHLRGSDALIFTRRSGRASQAAFPTRLPEYLATAKPVIASDVSDIREYLIPGRDALVVKPDSAAAIADAIIQLSRLPDRGCAMGQAGRARCVEHFHYRKRAEEMLAFFERDILGSRQRAAAGAGA